MDSTFDEARLREPFVVAVLIATHNRPELLAERSLPSVDHQSRRPDVVVVVDDSDDSFRERNRGIVASSNLHAIYLPNTRARGASGAWNTGLAWLAAHFEAPETVFVAVLDDDDGWEERHLKVCLETAVRERLDMAIPGLVRHDAECAAGRRQTLARSLDEGALLTGNPHIQGSNLFVRLLVLLEAGLFDEALPSTTDRDLCLRVLDLGSTRVGAVDVHTVHHHAEPDRERLSASASPEKHAGLTAFWRKYVGRMGTAQRATFLERAQYLFAWQPPPLALNEAPALHHAPKPMDGVEPLALVVGIIVDPERVRGLGPLLDDLRHLADDGFAGVDVVLLENGPREDNGRALRTLVDQKRREGLRVVLIGLERQQQDAREGAFGAPFGRGSGRVGIAIARTMVQRYAHAFTWFRAHAVVWILDDDKRLDLGNFGNDAAALGPHLAQLRSTGVHVVLGQDVDSPPLPAASTVRAQLVDLLHNLRWLAGLPPADTLPDRSPENVLLETWHADYCHDLSRDTVHLEAPWWMAPARAGETVREAFLRLADRLPRILAGEQIFRPLRTNAGTAAREEVASSIHRGGSTFVFDLDTLAVPNRSVDLGLGEVRRSDMTWALLNRSRGCAIVRAPLFVRHDRTQAPSKALDFGLLGRDIQGHALYSALAEVLERAPILPPNQDLVAYGVRRFHEHLESRLLSFGLTGHRVRGLVKSIQRVLSGDGCFAWWQGDAGARAAADDMRRMVGGLGDAFGRDAISALERRTRQVDGSTLDSYFRSLGERSEAPESTRLSIRTFLDGERAAIAAAQVERLCGASNLQILGSGMEGVSFTDGRVVFKYLDYWKAKASDEQRTFLRGLIGQWTDTRALYPLLELREDGVHVVLVYPFEAGEPYGGGHGPSLVQLLRECRTQGLVCRNVHPKNLLVTKGGVRLIDYGSDIRPFTEAGFEQMCRRAWLTWRWHHRPDLDVLMRAALQRTDLPELEGYERFRRALEPKHQDEILDPLLREVALGLRPRRVLDHGCGKARLARSLAKEVPGVVGFDPDATARGHWPVADLPNLRLIADTDLLAREPAFDVVVSSLVLCTLDDVIYRRVLNDLRRFTAEDGRLVLAVCNPFFTCGGPTPFQERHAPANVDEGGTFTWRKVVSGISRTDVHRPWDRLRRDLLRAGFRVESMRMTETVDLERFEPSSDFLVAVLRAVPTTGPRVSLLIRTCAMEWQTIEVQVRHLVDQLEPPRAFFERVLVVDHRTENFARQHATVDPVAYDRALERLVQTGVVDRIERVPMDPAALGALHQRWFGVHCAHAHTANGAPVASSLHGFESCQGEYILHVDADLMIARRDHHHDVIGDMIQVFETDDRALSVALNICQTEDHPYTFSGPSGPWRVEVRACLVQRERLLRALPLPNSLRENRLLLSWHRAMDLLVGHGFWRSYRGGDRRTFFIHPPNDRKVTAGDWTAVLDRVEAGQELEEQRGRVDLVGSTELWLSPTRTEPYVFVITGRDVPSGRFLRCIESLRRQKGLWGAVVIDDASRPSIRDFVSHALADLSDRVTLLRPRLRRGLLANTVWAIRHVCIDPETVILTLDADDALIGDRVVERVASEYDRGADVTIGSMLHTFKHVTYPVRFENLRTGRGGGNVWQHLRTFKKRLFDAIPDDALRLDGAYVDLATDWAFMIPIVERAMKPIFIPDASYLYEPSGASTGHARERREQIISRILANVSSTSEGTS